MKSSPHFVSNYVGNSNLFKVIGSFFRSDMLDQNVENAEPYKKNNSCAKSIFGEFWDRLLYKPQSFNQNPNAVISSILLEEKGIAATEVIKSVLSRRLNISKNSTRINNAIKETRKIFHEDFPADFILEYQGERLGMMLLDICYDSNKNPQPVYRFNTNLKSFKGML